MGIGTENSEYFGLAMILDPVGGVRKVEEGEDMPRHSISEQALRILMF